MKRASAVDLRRELGKLASQQAGYFTAAQARRAGYSYPAQQYHTERGTWIRADRGIYRLRDWPASAHDDLVRWTLWSRLAGVVSHETALAVHELGDVMPSRVHLTVPPGFRARSPAVVLHEGSLSADDVEVRAGFSVTTPLRSILDGAASLEIDHLGRAIEDALRRGLLTPFQLRTRADAFGAPAALAIERALPRAINDL